MTDLQIALEVLRHEGITAEQIHARRAEFSTAIGAEIERVCAAEAGRFIALNGTREILTETAAHPLFVNALLTGNLKPAAKFKLDFVGLSGFFDFSLGAFGEESHRREDLPAIAARNISERFDYEFQPSQFIVLGDTPNDIACARHFGAKSVAVATGRNHPPETLVPFKPDFLFEDLTDTAKILQTLETL